MRQSKQLYNRAAAGARIRSCRERLGLSRQRMAERIGKAEKYYADIERGYCGMSLETMQPAWFRSLSIFSTRENGSAEDLSSRGRFGLARGGALRV